MTKEDAIKTLRELWRETNDSWYEETYKMAIEALSADRPTGEWKWYNADNPDWLRKDGTPVFLVCDKCHNIVLNNASGKWNYCPNCGARMVKGGGTE